MSARVGRLAPLLAPPSIPRLIAEDSLLGRPPILVADQSRHAGSASPCLVAARLVPRFDLIFKAGFDQELLSEAARGQRQLTCIKASHTVLNLGDLPAPETLGLESRHLIDGLTPRMVAVTHKLGVAALPCFLATQHPDLILLPGIPSAHWGHTWLLHHKDLRQSARIRALFKHLAELGEKWPSAWDTSVEKQIQAA